MSSYCQAKRSKWILFYILLWLLELLFCLERRSSKNAIAAIQTSTGMNIMNGIPSLSLLEEDIV